MYGTDYILPQNTYNVHEATDEENDGRKDSRYVQDGKALAARVTWTSSIRRRIHR